jgi:hypothetical protein
MEFALADKRQNDDFNAATELREEIVNAARIASLFLALYLRPKSHVGADREACDN